MPVRGTESYQRYDPDFAYRRYRVDTPGQPLALEQFVEVAAGYVDRALEWPG